MMRRFVTGLALVSACFFCASAALAAPGTVQMLGQAPQNPDAPGDPLAVVPVSVPSPTGIGVSIAVDCDGVLYYTNYFEGVLHSMTATGTHIASVALTAAGAGVYIDEMAWDNDRGALWGATPTSPATIYKIDPATGACTDPFTGMGGYSLTDGLAYDDSDDSIWHSSDVSTEIYHFATDGTFLGILTPVDGAGSPLGSVSGVCVGLGDRLYIGRDGLGEIDIISKSTGVLISSFATPGGRDEGLECDPLNFAPALALWSKDAYNNLVTAIEVEDETCACGGATGVDQTTWGQLKSKSMVR